MNSAFLPSVMNILAPFSLLSSQGDASSVYPLSSLHPSSTSSLFPFSQFTFSPPSTPIPLTLEIWTPFVPGNVSISSLPFLCLDFILPAASPYSISCNDPTTIPCPITNNETSTRFRFLLSSSFPSNSEDSSLQIILARHQELRHFVDLFHSSLAQATLSSTSHAAIADELASLFSPWSHNNPLWNSSPALAYLFPSLSRSQRSSFLQSIQKFSPSLPSFPISPDTIFHELIAFYRDWRICGDFAFLQQNWSTWRTLLTQIQIPKTSSLSLSALKISVEMALAMEDFDFVAIFDELLNQSINSFVPSAFNYEILTNEGLITEALSLALALNNRTDGEWHNPWRELSPNNTSSPNLPSAFGRLLSESGFHANLAKGEIGFAPHTPDPLHPTPFSTFWSIGSAWGTFIVSSEGCELTTLLGTLPLTLLSLSFVTPRVLFNGRPLSRHEDLCWHA